MRRDPADPGLRALAALSAHLAAVRDGWLYALDGDAISRQGPRIVGGAARCARRSTRCGASAARALSARSLPLRLPC